MLIFSAPRGKYINKGNGIKLIGGVTLENTEMQASLNAPTVTWSSKSKEIVAEGGVTINFEEFGSSYCDRSRFSPDFENIALEGNATSKINL